MGGASAAKRTSDYLRGVLVFLGIDFGTSFSQAATIDDLEQPSILLNPGEYGVPSDFYYDRKNGILIGEDALAAGQGSAARNLVSEVKMALAEKDKDGNLLHKSFTLDGKTFSTREIVREIYRVLVLKAVQVAKKRFGNADIEGVVISIPAKFTMQERCLIAGAAKECLGSKGLPLKAIIKEPVAAALAYFKTGLENGRHILVYDLGGGTCDVALVKSDSSVSEHYSVVDSDMVRLGGRNWDEELEKYITVRIENQSGIKIKGNVGYEEKIRRTAITVKHNLSDPSKESSIARVELNGKIYTESITRNIFDEITSDLLRKTFDCLQEVHERNASSCSIDEIICVGGSSNMLQVEKGLMERFPKFTIRIFEPEHAVVTGAAIYAHMPKRNLEDVASFSYGTAAWRHYGTPDQKRIVSNIIKRGTKLPALCSETYSPVKDGQEAVSFDIYESEQDQDEFDFSNPDKRFIGTARIVLPQNSTKSLILRCQLCLNQEGMLEVEASEPPGRKVQAEFNIHDL